MRSVSWLGLPCEGMTVGKDRHLRLLAVHRAMFLQRAAAITAKPKQTLASMKFLGRGGKVEYGAITKSAIAAL